MATAANVRVRKFNPGKRVYFRGRWYDSAMVKVIKAVEREQGYNEYFYQGSFNTGVSQSAGTHNRGGVFDKQSKGLNNRKRYARKGVVCCPRTRAQGFMPHDHAWLHGANTASAGLMGQMYEWANGGDGLVGSRRDDSGVRGVFRHYNDWRKSLSANTGTVKIAPKAYLKAINASRKYGSKVRAYNSVKLMQKALNTIYAGTPLKVDGILGPVSLALFNRWRKANFGAAGAVGSIGAVSLKALFKQAKMSVSIYTESGGRKL